MFSCTLNRQLGSSYNLVANIHLHILSNGTCVANANQYRCSNNMPCYTVGTTIYSSQFLTNCHCFTIIYHVNEYIIMSRSFN